LSSAPKGKIDGKKVQVDDSILDPQSESAESAESAF
jgi:hypothetical protein